MFIVLQSFGLTSDGKAYVSANNFPYIHDYLKTRLPEMGSQSLFHNGRTYIFTCITNEGEREFTKLASQMYGNFITLYY